MNDDNFNRAMQAAFLSEIEKISSAKLFGAAALGGGITIGAGKVSDMYSLAKQQEDENRDKKMLKRMQALQARINLKKQYGEAFSE